MGIDRDTLAVLEQLVRRIGNRIANTVSRGVVHRTNDAKKQQLLQIGALADETIDDAEYFHPYGLSSVPLPGAEVAVVFPNGDRGHPLVVAASDRRHRPTGKQPGEVTLYNNAGASLTMTKDGDIVGRPAPGRKFFVSDEDGNTEPAVKKSEFDGHTHGPGSFTTPSAGGGGGPVTGASGGAAAVTGTTTFEAK